MTTMSPMHFPTELFSDGLGREKYYEPVERGFEREVKRRLEY